MERLIIGLIITLFTRLTYLPVLMEVLYIASFDVTCRKQNSITFCPNRRSYIFLPESQASSKTIRISHVKEEARSSNLRSNQKQNQVETRKDWRWFGRIVSFLETPSRCLWRGRDKADRIAAVEERRRIDYHLAAWRQGKSPGIKLKYDDRCWWSPRER